jgi:hypothetical protein
MEFSAGVFFHGSGILGAFHLAGPDPREHPVQDGFDRSTVGMQIVTDDGRADRELPPAPGL